MKSFSIAEINSVLKGKILGETSAVINGPEQLEKAQEGDITVIGNRKYARLWENSNASAAVIDEKIDLEPGSNRVLIKVQNADLAMAQILELFDPGLPAFEQEIHPSAVVHETATLGKGCKIGANSYIGKNVVLGDGTVLYPNVTIMDDTNIGNGCTIWSGTVIRERTEIGHYCLFHTNVSIGRRFWF
jgi:UDP-3-O-[3-hydroxymyristoyl] glucosamine N-acyltransferase